MDLRLQRKVPAVCYKHSYLQSLFRFPYTSVLIWKRAPTSRWRMFGGGYKRVYDSHLFYFLRMNQLHEDVISPSRYSRYSNTLKAAGL